MSSPDYQPTIVSTSAAAAGDAADVSRADVSRADVGFVVGSRPKFADETAELLRRRLTAVTLALVVILVAALVGSLIQGTDAVLWLRVMILVMLGACLIGLRSGRDSTLR